MQSNKKETGNAVKNLVKNMHRQFTEGETRKTTEKLVSV